MHCKIKYLKIIQNYKIKTLTFSSGDDKCGSGKFTCKVCPGFSCPFILIDNLVFYDYLGVQTISI